MSQILLFRHAQAMLPDSSGKDFDRCLSHSGEHDAQQQAQRIFDAGFRPDQVVCSAARRTMQTAAIICDFLNKTSPHQSPLNPQPLAQLYRADAYGYISAIREIASQDTRCLLLVGHNPSIEDLALIFAEHCDESLTKRIGYGFPTAGAAIIETSDPLRDLSRESAKLTDLLFIRR